MTAPRLDLRWRPANRRALAALCLLAAVAVAARTAGRRLIVGEHIPVNQQRVAAASEKIDLNTADAASLCRLPQIGPARAMAIIAFRRDRRFQRPQDVQAVSGIGPAIAEGIIPLVKFQAQAPCSLPSSAPSP